MVIAVQHQLEEKRLVCRVTGNRVFNDLHACTVVVARAEQQADEHHDRAANRNAGVLVRQKCLNR